MTSRDIYPNGYHSSPASEHRKTNRAAELEQILEGISPEVVNFIRNGETDLVPQDSHDAQTQEKNREALVHPDSSTPESLDETLKDDLNLEIEGSYNEGLQALVSKILKYSVRTSAPGFLDKLYAAPLPPGIAAELILGVLNTNVHVYQVSPVLTLIEKAVTKSLADMFGLRGARAGGISVQGGSASNMTSIVIARNNLFPKTKLHGNSVVKGRLLLYTSAHGHYSIEKAAQALGFGSQNVVPVPVDEEGRMNVDALSTSIEQAKTRGDVPFYINATAGTTVLGSFDPFQSIAEIARKHNMWFHVDAAWGGGFVFSGKPENTLKLQGMELADSIATNPHKMLGVPVTCSFLLGRDLRKFQTANTLKAGYLFHEEEASEDDDNSEMLDALDGKTNEQSLKDDNASDEEGWTEPYDLADLTLQCGRRGDSLKFFLCWKYYGTLDYRKMVDDAYDNACFMMQVVRASHDLTPVLHSSTSVLPSCLQVCFYYTPGGNFVHALANNQGQENAINPTNSADSASTYKAKVGKMNSRITSRTVKLLISRGFMIDFAPALEGQEDRGSFFRVVINISTARETVQRLVSELVLAGEFVVAQLNSKHERRHSSHPGGR